MRWMTSCTDPVILAVGGGGNGVCAIRQKMESHGYAVTKADHGSRLLPRKQSLSMHKMRAIRSFLG